MCGRYASFTPPDAIARLMKVLRHIPNIAPSWNVAPSQEAMVVRLHPQTGERRLDLLRWGLVPHWSMDPTNERKPINARAETVATTQMFRRAFARRRCLVPADVFYEWQKLPGGRSSPTRSPAPTASPLPSPGYGKAGAARRARCYVHSRSSSRPPTARWSRSIEPDDWPLWLGEVEGDPAKLLPARDDSALKIWPVSRRVNTPTNNDAGLLETIAGEKP
jgi:putative SOS response-associated peptidase YedK